MKKYNSFYIVIGIFFVSLLTINLFFFKGSRSFPGVTYSKKYIVNTERASIAGKTYVIPGQRIEPGDLLLELSSPELTLEIETLKKEIEVLTTQKIENEKLLQSKIKLIESERDLIKGETGNEIQLYQNQIDLNKSLTKQITRDQNTDTKNDTLTDFHLQIKYLAKRGLLSLQALDVRILDEKQKFATDQAKIQTAIEIAQETLNWKLEEEARLNKYATFPGVIDSVFVKPGEQIQAFSPVVSINTISPTEVISYLVGTVNRNKALGDSVTVQSLERSKTSVKGNIIGYGSVVPLPDILQKSSSITTFGLEVFVNIPAENPLVVGETVIIK